MKTNLLDLYAFFTRWHVFPHNAELVLMSNYSLTFGVKMTHDLDDRFNQVRLYWTH